jgi:hypothetical protein
VISVLCPTRGRPEALDRSIRSLRDTASDPVEILLRVDDDDQPPDGGDRVLTGRRVGYEQMHLMYDELAAEASGEWLFLWNDDAVMLTDCWDDVVHEHDPDLILNPATNHGPTLTPFPIVPAWMPRLLGHFSLNRHCDSWWEEIGRRLGRLVPVPIEVLHDRADLTGGNDDMTFAARCYDPDFYGPANLSLIGRDVETLRRAL